MNLTKTEKEVFNMIVLGYRTEDIAKELFRGIKTIESHRSSILKKTQSRSMAQAVYKICCQQKEKNFKIENALKND